MPVSEVSNIAPIINELERLQPLRIADLGIGCGLTGALIRNYLEGRHGRVKPEQWLHRLIGVEGFRGYENSLWDCYDGVILDDFSKPSIYQSIADCDVVLMLDSLEHLEPEVGKVVLDTLVNNNKRVIVSVPLGKCPQDGVFGNEFERHRTTFWGVEDFKRFKTKVLHDDICLVVRLEKK